MALASTSKQPTETRQASLIAAALALAAERSPADVTTAQLAEAIGVTQGAVFRHFESKEAIWLAVLDDASERLLARLRQAAAQHPANGLHALEAVFQAHVDFVVHHPGLPRLVFQELQRPDETALKAKVRQLMQAYRMLLVQLLQRGQSEELIAPTVEPHAATVVLMGAVQGLVMQALMSGNVAAMRAQAPRVFQILRAGLLP